jgi:hypothetical protein
MDAAFTRLDCHDAQLRIPDVARRLAVQQEIMATAVTIGGWIGQRVIPLHLIPLAIAAWAVWVIVSAEHNKMTIEH